ncbi:MAG TPA: type II CAAX endopeptidase family protein [Candidatus Elarobacter sp.]
MPLSPTRSPDTGFVWWQSLLFAVLLIGALIVPGVLALAFMIAAGWAHLRDLQSMSWPLIASQFVAYAAALGVIFRLLPVLANRSLRELGLRAPRWRDIGFAMFGAIVMVLVSASVAVVQENVFHVKSDEVQVHWLRDARGPLIWMFVVLACAAAPFFEELTFRGFVFNAVRRYLPPWFAIGVTGFVFGLAHIQPGNAGAIAPLAAGGVVLTWVYYRSGSLVASMLTHASFNLVTVVLVLVFHQM